MSYAVTFESKMAEAVVVLGGDDDVLHPRVLRRLHPRLGVELHGVELRARTSRTRRTGMLRARHDPLAARRRPLAVPVPGRHGVEPPVDEHPEARVAPPCHPRILLRCGLRTSGASLGYCCTRADDGEGQTDHETSKLHEMISEMGQLAWR